jgi:hypothetical protein
MDRHLSEAKAVDPGLVGHLPVHHVAGDADPVELRLLEHLAAIGPKPARGVADRNAGHEGDVLVGEPGEDWAPEAPLAAPSAHDVSRADHHVASLELLQELRNLARMVGEIGVHLEEHPVALWIQEALPKRRDHGRTPAALAVAREQVDPARIFEHRLLDRGRGAVRAPVVRHPDVDSRTERQELVDEGGHVLPLVVGGHHHEHPADHAISRRVARVAATTDSAWASVRPG